MSRTVLDVGCDAAFCHVWLTKKNAYEGKLYTTAIMTKTIQNCSVATRYFHKQTVFTKICPISLDVIQERQRRIQGETATGRREGGNSHPHQSPAPLSRHHAIFILSQSASEPGRQAVKPAGFTPKVLLILLPSISSTTTPPCLSACRQICVCQTLLWRSKSDLRGASSLTLPLTQEQMHH